MKNSRSVRTLGWAGFWALALTLASATPVLALGDMNTVLDNIRNWLAGILAGIATVFLTIGGIRYLTAMGNPRAMEQGKEALKSAAMGYALAVLAPVVVSIIQAIVKI